MPVVSLHVLHHRIKPLQGPNPLGSSLVSYQLVSHALGSSPCKSWIAYGTILLLATYHTLAGVRKMVSNKRKPSKLQTPAWRGGWGVLVATTGLGLARLAAEAGDVPLWLARRYDMVL